MFGDVVINYAPLGSASNIRYLDTYSSVFRLLAPFKIETLSANVHCSKCLHAALMSTEDHDSWGKLSPIYSQVERLTIPPCKILLERVCTLLPLSTPNSTAFDNGCGTGVLTSVLKDKYPNVPLLATDASDGMISILKRRISDQKWADATARVVDSRHLSEIQDESFTHTFSTFMVCLAPDPDTIVQEMLRVTKAGGVLGLATWGDPRFGRFFTPWEKACRELMPGYEAPPVMEEEWTLAANVEAGLVRAGFKDVRVWVEELTWRWESAEALAEYLFKGGNPPNVKVIESFKARGGNVEEARKIYERVAKEEYGLGDGSVGVQIPATLSTARK